MELLSRKSFVVLNDGSEETEGSEEEKSKEQEFCESMTDVLVPLVGAVSRVVDYYVSHNAGTWKRALKVSSSVNMLPAWVPQQHRLALKPIMKRAKAVRPEIRRARAR